MSKKYLLNIQPQAYQIYEVFERYSYTETYALAEFIDNSTASFIKHKSELQKKDINKLVVDINYDNQTDVLTIEDNAYGMELPEFRNSILIGENKGKNPHTRNQFGSGMKTAATWFGSNWTIESSELGSAHKYTATIDVQEIKARKTNEIDIIEDVEQKDKHYTRITIRQLHRDLDGKDTIKETINLLGSMYRRDLAVGDTEINVNGKTLEYTDVEVFIDSDNTEWKKTITVDFDFDDNGKNKHYTATGFVGIAKQRTGFKRTGFTLFQNDRGILLNYKPQAIFIQDQSQISLKLFGEIEMDEFEVNQAKDGFSWTKALQEKFWATLKSQITEYINMAAKNWSDILTEPPKPKPPKPVPEPTPTPQPEPVVSPVPGPDPVPYPFPPDTPVVVSVEDNQFKVYLDTAEYEIVIEDDMSNNFLYDDKKLPLLKINKNHPFIKNIKGEGLLEVSKTILCYVLAIENAEKMKDKKGFVMTSVVRMQFNSLLGKVRSE